MESRDSYLKRNYGIDQEEYELMLEEQDERCAICRKLPQVKNNEPEILSVDHCHRSGEVRGLLCRKCNSLIGLANDSTEILMQAIQYLQR